MNKAVELAHLYDVRKTCKEGIVQALDKMDEAGDRDEWDRWYDDKLIWIKRHEFVNKRIEKIEEGEGESDFEDFMRVLIVIGIVAWVLYKAFG